LKERILRRDETLMVVLQAFEVDKDYKGLAENLRVLLSVNSAAATTPTTTTQSTSSPAPASQQPQN